MAAGIMCLSTYRLLWIWPWVQASWTSGPTSRLSATCRPLVQACFPFQAPQVSLPRTCWLCKTKLVPRLWSPTGRLAVLLWRPSQCHSISRFGCVIDVLGNCDKPDSCRYRPQQQVYPSYCLLGRRESTDGAGVGSGQHTSALFMKY